ncbi:MAG: hypothetical protein JST84_26265 [Acidobacteria bacterium]|nr:hypothetical protein [Acidobacteriota bacterium]
MTLLVQLNSLEATGLIRLATVQPELEYLFRHALVQDAAYGSLLKNDRRHLHQAVGEALESLYPQQCDELAATLALHFEKADAHEKALRYFALAAERASESYANTEAIAFYESAIVQAAHLRSPTIETRITVLHEGIGDVYKRVGQHEAARAQYARAHDLQAAQPQPDRLLQARVQRKSGATLTPERQFAAADVIWDNAEQLLGTLSDESDQALWDEWIEIQVERTWRYYWEAATDEMEQICDRVLPLVERRGTPAQQARALGVYTLYFFRRERLVVSDATIALQRKVLHYAQEAKSPPLECDAYFGLGFYHLFRRELPEAEENLRAAYALAERMGAPVHIARSANYLMFLARMRGQVEKARSYFPTILNNNWAGPMADYTVQVYACEAWMAWRAGDWDTTEAKVEAAIARIAHGWKVYPLKWTALFPALGAAVSKKQMEKAAEWAQLLLAPDQMALPADLTAVLETGIQLAGQDTDAALIAFAEAIQLGLGYGYL